MAEPSVTTDSGEGGSQNRPRNGAAPPQVQVARLRRALAGLPLPAWPDGRIRLAADVSNWLRPDAATSPELLFCHCYGRGKGNAQLIPGWPYSFVAALEPGRTSWTLPLDAVRLGPAGSPRPGSGPGSGASTRRCPAWPARRNPANPAPAARRDRRTATRPPATTWARPSRETSPGRKPAGRRVKQQAYRNRRPLMRVPTPREPRQGSSRRATVRYALGSNARTARFCLIWLVMTGGPATALVEVLSPYPVMPGGSGSHGCPWCHHPLTFPPRCPRGRSVPFSALEAKKRVPSGNRAGLAGRRAVPPACPCLHPARP
jgi:DDE superfamily endonuclease